MDIQKRAGTKRRTAAAAALALALSVAAPAMTAEAATGTVGFGGKEWLVVGGKEGTSGVAAEEGALTLFAKDVDFGRSYFGDDGRYNGSTLQREMAAKADSLDDSEKDLIKGRTLQPSDGIEGDPAANQLFWPLSVEEHRKLSSAEQYISEQDTAYWLRTYMLTDEYGSYVYAAAYNGKVVIQYRVNSFQFYLRPALWLDVSLALFTTEATGDKADLADGNAPLPGYTPPEDDYKFTMEDDDLAPDFAPDGLVSRRGRTLTVSYSGAEYAEGKTRFLSALVRRGGDAFYGNVTHYGRLKAIGSTEDESGSVEV
ncbi:MAG: hypothetical protein LBQ15_01360, partial [Clostridium sp.]|nr:hypothetical protein [Clostridium sp.]